MLSSENILNVLSKVKHPDLQDDIVKLGMVKNLQVAEQSISFTLKFKAFNDPFKQSIKNHCEQLIHQHFGDKVSADIKIDAGIKVPPQPSQNILEGTRNIIAIASGKGGVGKSTVAVNMAVAFARKGFKVGLIDADIFGPSIPKMFGAENIRPTGEKRDGKDWIIPVEKFGVKMLSIGFFVDNNEAVVWRGPMASNALKQLMTDAIWGDLDYLFVDLPPGTSDIHLTLVQSVPVTGAVIVSTPQDVALADAIKGIRMFTNERINVPVLGLIENMAWFTPAELPENKYYIFGKEGCKKLAMETNVPLLGQVPLVQGIRESGDQGQPSASGDDQISGFFNQVADELIKQVEIRNEKEEPTKRVEISRTSFKQH